MKVSSINSLFNLRKCKPWVDELFGTFIPRNEF
jgi:hypothetical protein